MHRSFLLLLLWVPSAHAQLRLERVASTASDLDIGRIGSFAAARHGEIFVADADLQHIIVYDSTGKRIRTIGRKGDGPLEFRALRNLAWLADTLVAYDAQLRTTFIRPEGGLLRTVPWPATERPDRWLGAGGPHLYVVAYGRGRTVPISGLNSTQNIRPPKTFLAVHDSSAVPLQWAADSTADEYGWDCWNDPAKMIYVLGERPGGNGPFNAVTAGGQLVFASADRTRVWVQSAGARPRQVGTTYSPVPVTDLVWSREAQEYVELEKKAGKLTCSRPWGRLPAFPPIRAIAADDAGGFWIEVNDSDGSRYDIYDASSRLAGSVRAPTRRVPTMPFVVRNQKLYVAERDADDVVSITVYRLRR